MFYSNIMCQNYAYVDIKMNFYHMNRINILDKMQRHHDIQL